MNLKFDGIGAFHAGENRHPQQVMKDLGISYQHATPQSVADQWWFWNCDGVPSPLPSYLSELNVLPHDAIGHGLTREDADRISRNAVST